MMADDKPTNQVALEDGKFDEYGVRIRNGLYEVTVTKGTRSGYGMAPTEREAYEAAKKDLSPDESLKAEADAEADAEKSAKRK